jgi:hypothetical protein
MSSHRTLPRYPISLLVTLTDAPRTAAWSALWQELLAPEPTEPLPLRILPAQELPRASGDDDADTTGGDAA